MLYLKPLYNNLKTLDRFNELFSFLKTSEIAFVINFGFNFHKASNIFIEFAWFNKYNGNNYWYISSIKRIEFGFFNYI